MRVLALEPYYAGSHRQFLDGWMERSEHDWTALGLPGHKWKWRMRHAPITFAEDVRRRFANGERWDALFCSDMLNLGEFQALAPSELRELPTTVYFHENQFTYPRRTQDTRDFHFAFTNYITALTADQVWFNSHFHREEFLSAVASFLRRMPDNQGVANVDAIREKSSVHYPGVEPSHEPRTSASRPLTILWSSRWEYDKNPQEFFAALSMLKSNGVDFKVNVLGESFGEIPAVFEQSRETLSEHILQWGFVESRRRYFEVLAASDLIVSTAIHEFFGIAVAEALCAGVRPLLPNRLAYPELLDGVPSGADEFLYDGGADALAERLTRSATERAHPTDCNWFAKFHWQERAAEMDKAIFADPKKQGADKNGK
ncbi:DUF3524 domain-containing protein [Planctomycetota bacterium]